METKPAKWIKVMSKKTKYNNIDRSNTNSGYSDDYKNLKKILCNNILISKSCHYGNKCLYAHSLDDQNIDSIRRRAYDIIRGIEPINYRPDRELAKALQQLTKICEACANNKCAGGYNCKYGAINKIYRVCIDDLKNGVCYNTSCSSVHLSNRGLIPLNSNGKNSSRAVKYIDRLKEVNVPDGTLLSDDFFTNLKNNCKNKYNLAGSDESDGDDDETKNRIIAYLDQNSDSDLSCDESIDST